ncbi:MAG: hypothetical protein KAJ18_11260 [Candidatus Omnitrophica bacterium]|nr:hypothetical protein [Candidatus Omnitrophota bacterium]
MNKGKEQIEFQILENGLDFILSALNYISGPKEKSDLKYGVLRLSSGCELVLKERLRQEHWSLVFENIKKARRCLERIKRSQQIKT